jgi:glycosyltransferase involved in cell wall biosynthesis
MVAAAAPLISVVIPAFNANATLSCALDSVAAQTYPDWEAIVVDDASCDETALLVERRGDPRCRVIRRSARGGPSVARNDGIAAACGQWVAFLDADDEWLPEKLAAQAAAVAAQPDAGLVICDMRSVYEDGSEGTSVFARQAPRAGGEAWKTLLASSFIGTSTAMAPWRLLREIGGFDAGLKVGEDQDLFIRLARRAPVVVVDQALAVYHYRHASYSAGFASEQAAIVLGMVRRHLAAERGRLSWWERRCILAQRCGRLGRNLVAAGARGEGVALILKAAAWGSLTLENISALLYAARL